MADYESYLKQYEDQVKKREDLHDDAYCFDVKQLAEYLQCSEKVARDVMHQDGFPLIRAGNLLRVNRAAFIKWASERRD